MLITIEEFFKEHNLKASDGSYVLCVNNGYNPHFYSGSYYHISQGKLLSSSYRLRQLDKWVLNKLFIPLEGTPGFLTPRDQLMKILVKNRKLKQ